MNVVLRALFFILLFSMGPLALFSQSAEEDVIRLKNSQEIEAVESGSVKAGSNKAGLVEEGEAPSEKGVLPGSWNLSVGTGFSYMKGYGSGMGFYAAPTYTLPLNKRWSLHGGLMVSSYTGLGTPGYSAYSGYPGFGMPGATEFGGSGSVTGLSVFGAASYRMSERLVLHGTGVKQLVTSGPSSLTPYSNDRVTLGATYRLGRNISIGASVTMTNGQGFYRGSPFGNSSMFGSPYGSPFSAPYSAPFQSPFGW